MNLSSTLCVSKLATDGQRSEHVYHEAVNV